MVRSKNVAGQACLTSLASSIGLSWEILQRLVEYHVACVEIRGPETRYGQLKVMQAAVRVTTMPFSCVPSRIYTTRRSLELGVLAAVSGVHAQGTHPTCFRQPNNRRRGYDLPALAPDQAVTWSLHRWNICLTFRKSSTHFTRHRESRDEGNNEGEDVGGLHYDGLRSLPKDSGFFVKE